MLLSMLMLCSLLAEVGQHLTGRRCRRSHQEMPPMPATHLTGFWSPFHQGCTMKEMKEEGMEKRRRHPIVLGIQCCIFLLSVLLCLHQQVTKDAEPGLRGDLCLLAEQRTQH